MGIAPPPAPIWWPNLLFFSGMHLAAVVGTYYRPLWDSPRKTALLCFISWQLAVFGITIGYHRLFSHRSFTARRPLRIALALMGCLGFQGSIKWWCARHRLHHRYTDDPVHDPYCATKGLYYSHMGWIFRKPTYTRMHLIDRSDLDNDPVVRFQHKYYIPLTLGLGLALPALIASLWDDAWGGFIYGGIVARLLIWHCTFIVNSFAHWEGLQPYSEEMTARGNLIMAVLTGGEGNHNFHHAFPRDFRAGPHALDWDPSKWIIELLHAYTGLVTSVRVTREEDVRVARGLVESRHHSKSKPSTPPSVISDDEYAPLEPEPGPELETWSAERINIYINGQGQPEARAQNHKLTRAVLFVDGFVVDITEYTSIHPGGFAVLRPYLIQPTTSHAPCPCPSPPPAPANTPNNPAATSTTWRDASRAFNGGMNNHSHVAKWKMRGLRVARVDPDVVDALVRDDGF